MSEIGDTFAALKDLRKEYKAANPKCVKCGNQLGIARFSEGMTVCIKCDIAQIGEHREQPTQTGGKTNTPADGAENIAGCTEEQASA